MAKCRISQRLERVESFHVMSLMAEAKKLEAQGHLVIHMEMGEPDFLHLRPLLPLALPRYRQGLHTTLRH